MEEGSRRMRAGTRTSGSRARPAFVPGRRCLASGASPRTAEPDTGRLGCCHGCRRRLAVSERGSLGYEVVKLSPGDPMGI